MTSTQAPGTQPGIPIPETFDYAAEEVSPQKAVPPPSVEPVAARPLGVPAGVPPRPAVSGPQQRASGAFGLSPFMVWGLGGAAALAILAILLVLFWPSDDAPDLTEVKAPEQSEVKQSTPPGPPVVAQQLSVSIDVRPWAEIEIKGNGLAQSVRGVTPVRVSLPAGEYSLICSNPDFSTFTHTIQVSHSNRNFRLQFPQLNTDRVVDSLLR